MREKSHTNKQGIDRMPMGQGKRAGSTKTYAASTASARQLKPNNGSGSKIIDYSNRQDPLTKPRSSPAYRPNTNTRT